MSAQQKDPRTPSPVEEHCRDRLEAWLRQHIHNPTIGWVFEPNGHTTAPDFLLTLDGREFAVEVAIVMAYEQADKRLLSEHDIWNALYRLLKSTEQECLSAGTLAGAYRVGFEKGVPNFAKTQHELRHAIKRYVANTQFDAAAKDDVILINDKAVCVIGKMHSRANYIGMVKSGAGWDKQAGCSCARR